MSNEAPNRSLAGKTLLLFAGMAALWISSAACQFGDGDCLRMSDCDTGYTCVEGTCRSDTPADAPNTPADAGTDARSTTRANASTSDASRDGSSDGSARDGSADGSSTDASGI